jgi:MFS family permease
MIAVGAAMIPGGRLGDLRGHRRIVVAGLAVFGGASLICGLSFSYGMLIGFRALQGLDATRGGGGADRLAGTDPRQLRYRRGGLCG